MKPKLYLDDGTPLYLVHGKDIYAGEVQTPMEPHWHLVAWDKHTTGNTEHMYSLTFMVQGEWNGARYIFHGVLPEELQALLDSASD